MNNVLKIGNTIRFLNKTLPYIVIGNTDGTKEYWANEDDKLIARFIASEGDFLGFIVFLSDAFGYVFAKTECLHGDEVLSYKIVNIKNKT